MPTRFNISWFIKPLKSKSVVNNYYFQEGGPLLPPDQLFGPPPPLEATPESGDSLPPSSSSLMPPSSAGYGHYYSPELYTGYPVSTVFTQKAALQPTRQRTKARSNAGETIGWTVALID